MSNKDNANNFGSASNELTHVCSKVYSSAKNKVVPKLDPFKKTVLNSSDSKKISYGRVDKRVSLTVSPKTSTRDESLFVNKVRYVLGKKFQRPSWVLKGSYFYGLLYNALGTSSGLIFPYTPSVDFSHSVNYESVDITHSNISYNYYKNTPPPGITLSAKFTADNRQNALHMLSAIWFLTACTKCDFGERSNGYGGTPPPVLYLNGYDHLIDNIPVVISTVGYKYPEDAHYVNLILDMSKDNTSDSDFCKIYDITTTSEQREQTYEKGEDNNYSWQFTNAKPKVTSHERGINMSYWLPTELSITITLKIQPNLLKNRKQWSLDDYKTGLLMTSKGKNPPVDPIKWYEEIPEEFPVGTENGQQICDTKISLKEHISSTSFIPSGWTW